MKYLLSVILIIIVMTVAPQVCAFDAIASIGGGALLQDGADGKFALSTGFDVPTVARTDESNYEIVLGVRYLYADRSYGNANEIQAVITTTMTRRFFGDFYVGLGGGLWNIVDTEDQDDKPSVLRLELGARKYGIDLTAGCDVVLLQGQPDIYYPSLSVLLLSL